MVEMVLPTVHLLVIENRDGCDVVVFSYEGPAVQAAKEYLDEWKHQLGEEALANVNSALREGDVYEAMLMYEEAHPEHEQISVTEQQILCARPVPKRKGTYEK